MVPRLTCALGILCAVWSTTVDCSSGGTPQDAILLYGMHSPGLGHGHLSLHGVRSARPLLARQVSSPQCGPDGGNRSCPDSLCCSDYGYCGDGPDYCDVRFCQAPFGRCGNAPPPPPTTTAAPPQPPQTTSTTTAPSSAAPPPPSGTLTVSPGGQCGNSTTCAGSAFGDCCSEFYFCGRSDDYCAAGCRAAFGSCAGAAPPPPPTTTTTTGTSSSSTTATAAPTTTSAAQPRPSNASTDGRCGPEGRGQTCTGTNYGPCCSDYGYCGDGPDYCNPLYCQVQFGRCG